MKRILLSLLLVSALTTFETRPTIFPIFIGYGVIKEFVILTAISMVAPAATPPTPPTSSSDAKKDKKDKKEGEEELNETSQQKPQKLNDMSQVIEAKTATKEIKHA